ncbi:MAG: glycosyltransferase family 39 protein [Dehalococcoidia bacterium]|nr:glycosyltransferase family 39 protein [Dehalococcoidia bacterium]
MKADRYLVILICIFAVALTVRLGLICLEPRITPYYGMMTPIGDAARNLVEGRGYVIDREYIDRIMGLIYENNRLFDIQDVPPPENEKFEEYYGIPPGPSLLMVATYKVFNDYRYIYVRILQSFIDALGCFVIFLLGKELFNKKVGLTSSILYALWLPIAYLATWPLHDALMPFISLVIFYLFVKGVKNNSIKYYILSGLSCGIGCYFQPSIQLLPLFLGVGLLIYGLHKVDIWKQVCHAVKMTVITFGIMALIISPWIVRNNILTGDFAGMRPLGFWMGLWEMSGEFGDSPDGAILDDNSTLELARKELGFNVKWGSPECEDYFRPKVLNQIKDHTAWYLTLPIRRIPRAVINFSELGINLHPAIRTDYQVWLDYLYGTKDVQGYMEAAKGAQRGLQDGTFWNMVIKYPTGVFYLGLVWFFAFIPPLTSIIVFIVLRKNWRNFSLVAVLPIYFIIIHIMLMVASYKSMVPGQIGYIVFCAFLISLLWKRPLPSISTAIA